VVGGSLPTPPVDDDVAAKRSDNNDRVKFVQRRLNDIRNAVAARNRFDELATDGVYGPITAEAVAKVQHNYGVRGSDINGDVLDGITWGYILMFAHGTNAEHGGGTSGMTQSQGDNRYVRKGNHTISLS
jgi:peptidoglycan hydrolase-like protein with peptidoglycan-binding domain